MGCAGPAGAEGNDVLAPVNILRTGRFHDQRFVERGHDGDVEAIQAFDGRKLCRLDPALNHAPFALDQFQLRKARQILDVGLVTSGTVLSKLVVLR